MSAPSVARDLFARHLDLGPLRGRPRGKVRCIFHSPDRSPSLSVDLERGVFHCFGCEEKGGVKRFAELVGEAVKQSALGPSRPRQPRYRSPFNEARERVLADARHQGERLAPWRDAARIADHVRLGHRSAQIALALATRLGDTDSAWELLELAAEAEHEALALEAELDRA